MIILIQKDNAGFHKTICKIGNTEKDKFLYTIPYYPGSKPNRELF